MWNILIVIIIAIIIWMFNPLGHFQMNPGENKVDQKTMNEVNEVTNKVQQQVDDARKLQEQQMNNLNNQ